MAELKIQRLFFKELFFQIYNILYLLIVVSCWDEFVLGFLFPWTQIINLYTWFSVFMLCYNYIHLNLKHVKKLFFGTCKLVLKHFQTFCLMNEVLLHYSSVYKLYTVNIELIKIYSFFGVILFFIFSFSHIYTYCMYVDFFSIVSCGFS